MAAAVQLGREAVHLLLQRRARLLRFLQPLAQGGTRRRALLPRLAMLKRRKTGSMSFLEKGEGTRDGMCPGCVTF